MINPPLAAAMTRAKVHRWRRLTLVLVAWTGLCAFGLFVQLTNNHGPGFDVCVHSGFDRASCQDNYGYGPGWKLLMLVWLAGFASVGGLWLVTRPRRRRCSSCGSVIAAGKTSCSTCRSDDLLASRLLTVALLAVSLLTLLLYYSNLVVTDGDSCSMDVVTTGHADLELSVGAATAGIVGCALFVLAAPGRLRRSRWRYAVAVPLSALTFVAVVAAAFVVPALGLLPGIDCR